MRGSTKSLMGPKVKILMGQMANTLGSGPWAYVFGVFLGRCFAIFDDFLKTKKMRNVRTIILAAVSRRDLCYVTENEGFRF